MVEEHLEEAIVTIKKLPQVKVQGYFSLWPDIKYTPNELMMQEVRSPRSPATPDAITRLEQTFDWTQCLTILERKLIWRRAARVPWKVICQEFGYGRTAMWDKWVKALKTISNNLNKRQVQSKKD